MPLRVMCVAGARPNYMKVKPVLGVPCLTVRDNTERPITISEGTNRLVGRDPSAVVAAAREVLADPPPARRPELWDGRAGERIAEVLLSGGTAENHARPTELGPRVSITPE